MPTVGHYHQSIIIKSFSEVFHSHFCGASEPQHNQDLKEIYKLGRIFEFITFYQNALHLTRVLAPFFIAPCILHCATNNLEIGKACDIDCDDCGVSPCAHGRSLSPGDYNKVI